MKKIYQALKQFTGAPSDPFKRILDKIALILSYHKPRHLCPSSLTYYQFSPPSTLHDQPGPLCYFDLCYVFPAIQLRIPLLGYTALPSKGLQATVANEFFAIILHSANLPVLELLIPVSSSWKTPCSFKDTLHKDITILCHHLTKSQIGDI